MTLLEIEDSLPNGLHDAEVHRISTDYEERTLTLDLAVWIGDMDDSPERRESYQEGRLKVAGLEFVVVEAPDSRYPFREPGHLTIDGCDMSKNLDNKLVESLPADCFLRSFFAAEWNSFIHVAARSAELVWKNSGTVSYR